MTILLAGRFEHRLTTVIAPAGSGKTTALAQAVRSNMLDPVGADLWLGASSLDADPATLLSGLLQACGKQASGDNSADTTALCDAIWRRSPTRVTLIIDDAHYLGEASGALIDQLLNKLPQNGQLMLSGRQLPPLTIARLRAHHRLLEITEEQLNLDDNEVATLAQARGHADLSSLSRHVASAELRLTAGPEAAMDFLWEEVLGGIDPERLRALCRVSLLNEIDDQLALALSKGNYNASELTQGLPMVETHADGSRRLHSILREPLASRLSSSEQNAALMVAGKVEQSRGRLARACELFAQAEQGNAAMDVAREFIVLPTLNTRMDTVRSLRSSIAAAADGSGLFLLLDAYCHMNLPAEAAIVKFIEAAELARTEGDKLVESVAVFRAMQVSHNHDYVLDPAHAVRMAQLASEVPYAVGVRAHLRSLTLQLEGDPEGSLAELAGYDPLGKEAATVMRAERLCDLGRPEMVGAELTPEDLASLPQGTEIYVAFAMWLRGEVTPEIALPIARPMVQDALDRRLILASVSVLAVATFIAVAAGDLRQAREYETRCADLCRHQDDARNHLFSSMASAAVASADGNEDLAADLLDPDRTLLPVEPWPSRPYLLGLPLTYLCRSGFREALDSMSFGPSLSTAMTAARALVQLRESANPRPAAELPWHQDAILRVHVLPHHLAELAAAAASEGVGPAEELLSQLPNSRMGIISASNSKRSSVAAWAKAYLESVPAVPEIRIMIQVLGPIQVRRDDAPIISSDWVRRARVQELLGLLVERRTVSRDEAAAALWPDLTPEKQASNLRVSLSRLRSILEPDRGRDDPPSYVIATGPKLMLSDTVQIDADEFDELIEEALATDRAGAPAEAIALYEKALVMVRGQYLADMDTTWASITRIRLDSVARTAMTRLAELQLAGGEPEKALKWAAKAHSENALDERAGRLMILSLLATGDRAGAASVAQVLRHALQQAPLSPEAETRRAFERVGIETITNSPRPE